MKKSVYSSQRVFSERRGGYYENRDTIFFLNFFLECGKIFLVSFCYLNCVSSHNKAPFGTAFIGESRPRPITTGNSSMSVFKFIDRHIGHLITFYLSHLGGGQIYSHQAQFG